MYGGGAGKLDTTTFLSGLVNQIEDRDLAAFIRQKMDIGESSESSLVHIYIESRFVRQHGQFALLNAANQQASRNGTGALETLYTLLNISGAPVSFLPGDAITFAVSRGVRVRS